MVEPSSPIGHRADEIGSRVEDVVNKSNELLRSVTKSSLDLQKSLERLKNKSVTASLESVPQPTNQQYKPQARPVVASQKSLALTSNKSDKPDDLVDVASPSRESEKPVVTQLITVDDSNESPDVSPSVKPKVSKYDSLLKAPEAHNLRASSAGSKRVHSASSRQSKAVGSEPHSNSPRRLSVASSKSKRGPSSFQRRLMYDHGQNYIDPTPPKEFEAQPLKTKSKFP